MSGFGGQVGIQFQIGNGYGQGWSQEVCVRHGETSNPEWESGGSVCGWKLVDLHSRLW